MYLFVIILVIISYILFFYIKEPKATTGFWSQQPMQKRKGIFPKRITKNKPKVYKKEGYDIKILRNWNPSYNTDFSSRIYQTMCKDKNSIVLGLYKRSRKYPVGFIYGQKQRLEGNKRFKDRLSIVYVSGLYLDKEYRNKGLTSILISNIIDKWWDRCNRFMFIHDKKILDKKIKPIQQKEISLYSPWLFWSYKENSQDRLILSSTRDISFMNKNNKYFLKRDFGMTYHLHNYSIYVHSIDDNMPFTIQKMMKLSTKYPYILWIYVPKNISSFKSTLNYTRYIYGYNIKGGGEKKGWNYLLYDI